MLEPVGRNTAPAVALGAYQALKENYSTAKVTNGDKTFLVSENESTYILLGKIHALENPGKIPLEMIEVQTGSYLGEEDIVRFDDRYGRK